jgi:hypothetical protein
MRFRVYVASVLTGSSLLAPGAGYAATPDYWVVGKTYQGEIVFADASKITSVSNVIKRDWALFVPTLPGTEEGAAYSWMWMEFRCAKGAHLTRFLAATAFAESGGPMYTMPLTYSRKYLAAAPLSVSDRVSNWVCSGDDDGGQVVHIGPVSMDRIREFAKTLAADQAATQPVASGEPRGEPKQ